MWLLLLILHPLIGPFIFRDFIYHCWLVDPGQVLYVKLILSCRSFRPLPLCYVEWLSAYLVRWLPCIWINSTAKAYLCNQGSTVSPFLSRLACQLFSLTYKHGIMLIPAYIPTHLNMEADYLSWGQMLPERHLLPQVAQALFHLWGLPEVDLLASSHTTQYQCYYTLESPLPLGALGLNAFNHPLTFQVNYLCPPLTLVPLGLSKFLAEHVKGQLRCLILVAPCWMEVPWLPTVLNMLADVPQQSPIIKHLIIDVSVGHVLKGLPYLHLNPWQLREVCYANKDSLP